jgi:MFS family permease
MSETVIEQLGITVGQYSKLSSYFYLSYSTSCILVGFITSRMSKRKNLIVAMTLSTGLISLAMSFVTSYMGFALCRLAIGLFQGGSMSVMLAIIAKNLVKEDYGKRYGVITLGSSIISLFIGPVFFTYMALHYRWNTAYRFTGIILIMLGIITLVTTKEVNVEVFQKKASEGSPLRTTIKECIYSRIFVMCFFIGILETISNLSIGIFKPIYYTDIMSFDTATKAAYMSAGGIAYLPIGLAVPALADRFSVKKVMVGTFIVAWLAPLMIVVFPGTMFSAVMLTVLGAAGGATVSLFTYMIPRNSLPERLHGFSNGVILGVACLIGGTVAPAVLGDLIDKYNWTLPQVFGVIVVTYFLCIVLSGFINDSKPKPAGDIAQGQITKLKSAN